MSVAANVRRSALCKISDARTELLLNGYTMVSASLASPAITIVKRKPSLMVGVPRQKDNTTLGADVQKKQRENNQNRSLLRMYTLYI